MPRWIERRGYTLRVPSSGRTEFVEPGDRERLVRVSLMERVGLVTGWFNVREARAEPSGEGETLKVVGGGRPLSWRWLRSEEAERLLDQRLRTLQAMGYLLLDSDASARGRWDWLYEMIHRRLAKPTHEASANDDRPPPPPAQALRDALGHAGVSPDAIIEALAKVLGLGPHEFASPELGTVRKTNPDQLVLLLPFLLHHERAEVRAIGERWLKSPQVAYHLPAPTLLQWLESDERMSTVLVSRIADEGLALIGPDALVRLAHTGCSIVQPKARAWANRLGS